MDVHSQFLIAVTCYFAQIEEGIHFMNTKIEKKIYEGTEDYWPAHQDSGENRNRISNILS